MTNAAPAGTSASDALAWRRAADSAGVLGSSSRLAMAPGRGHRLSREAERRLILAAKAGDLAARDLLIDALRPLIGSIARVYRNSAAVDRNELMQEGALGVLRALQRYD